MVKSRRTCLKTGLAVLTALVLIAGCNSGGSGGSSSTSSLPASTAAGSSSASGGGSAAAIAQLYAAAKQDGSFVYWGGEDTGDMGKFFAAFEQEYPGVKPQQVSLAPQDVVQKLLAADAGGTSPVDLFNSNLDFMNPLLDKNLVNKDPGWSDLGVPSANVDPVGGILTQSTAYGLAYNTDSVKAADVPKTWDDLKNSKWAGKLSIDSRGNPWNILAIDWGQSTAVQYVKDLVSTAKPVVITGATAGLTSLAAGETSLRPAFISDAKTWQAKGAPVGFAWLDSVPIKNTYWYVAAKATHPNAAKLFGMWFSTSKTAIDLQQKLDYRTPAPPSDIPAGAKVMVQKTQADYTLGANVITAITPTLTGK